MIDMNLSFDENNVPCYSYMKKVDESGIDKMMEDHEIYSQEFKLNMWYQVHKTPFDWKRFWAGLLMLEVGVIWTKIGLGWGFGLVMVAFCIFDWLVEGKKT